MSYLQNRNIITQCSTILSFLFIAFAIFTIPFNQARGYELSIYSSTSWVIWLSLSYGIANGFLLLLMHLINKNGSWLIGYFQVAFCISIIVCLHALRGYHGYMGRGDTLTYIGLAKDIVFDGRISEVNFYPAVSVLISKLCLVCDLSASSVSSYLQIVFYIIYSTGTYCLSKSLNIGHKAIIASVFSSFPIFYAWFGVTVYHMFLSALLIPLLFSLLYKEHNIRYRILIIVILAIFPFYHPITAIAVLFFIIVINATEYMVPASKRITSPHMLLISFTIMSLWYIQQYMILRSAKQVILQLSGVLKTTTTLAKGGYYYTKLGLLNSLKATALMSLDEVIYYILSLIAIYLLLSEQRSEVKYRLQKIAVAFVSGTALLVLLFTFTKTHEPERLLNLNFNIMLTPILVGYLLSRLDLNPRGKSCIFLVSLFIAVSIGSSIISLYQSPFTVRPNDQVTLQDITGVNWLSNTKNQETKTLDIMTPAFRFIDLLHGNSYRLNRKDFYRDSFLPDHFGQTTDTFTTNENRYLLVSEYDILSYTEVWAFIGRFDKNDFSHLNCYSNVDLLYNNIEFKTYYAHKNNI